MLLDFVNAYGTAEQPANVSAQQQWAADLISANRLYRDASTAAGDEMVAAVLDELERSLLELVHGPATLTPQELDQIRLRLDAAALLFRVRVLSDRIARARDRLTYTQEHDMTRVMCRRLRQLARPRRPRRVGPADAAAGCRRRLCRRRRLPGDVRSMVAAAGAARDLHDAIPPVPAPPLVAMPFFELDKFYADFALPAGEAPTRAAASTRATACASTGPRNPMGRTKRRVS